MSEESGGSEPCFAHQLVGGHVVDPEAAHDVAQFRRAERKRLYAERRAVPQAETARMSEITGEALDRLIGPLQGRVIGAYWPIRSELNLIPWMKRAHGAGARILLPVVETERAPLIFRHWEPHCRMERGIWNIPVPAEGDPEIPDIVISPVVGIDEDLFRLGNGGGYYDRTLASFESMPWVIAVGQPFAQMKTIFPMPWDIPMTTLVLGDGTIRGRVPGEGAPGL